MAPKRHLGLAKAAKAKKQKVLLEVPAPNGKPEGTTELTVELGEEIDANDAVGQLLALWRTFLQTEEKKELIVNGIIHECDRILRKAHNGEKKEDDDEVISLSGTFYAVYAQALAALAFFHTEEPKLVADYFNEAQDRISAGKAAFPDSIELLFGEARILMNKIPLIEVSRLAVDTKMSKKHEDISVSLDKSLETWENAEQLSASRKEYHHFNVENLDFLQALDDLLEAVDSFGIATMEGEDSDNEDEADAHVELGESHPLYSVRNLDKYNKWWRDHSLLFLENLDKHIEQKGEKSSDTAELRRELCKRLGQLYLMEAEGPSSVFTTLTYYSQDKNEMDGLSREDAQKISKELFSKALEYLKDAQDDQEPDSWANVAEAMISLANIHDLESPEQEQLYKDAEDILTKANNATNGKYDVILENLLLN